MHFSSPLCTSLLPPRELWLPQCPQTVGPISTAQRASQPLPGLHPPTVASWGPPPGQHCPSLPDAHHLEKCCFTYHIVFLVISGRRMNPIPATVWRLGTEVPAARLHTLTHLHHQLQGIKVVGRVRFTRAEALYCTFSVPLAPTTVGAQYVCAANERLPNFSNPWGLRTYTQLAWRLTVRLAPTYLPLPSLSRTSSPSINELSGAPHKYRLLFFQNPAHLSRLLHKTCPAGAPQ